MTSIITRSAIITAIQNTVEDEEARVAAINAINRIYISEHVANNMDDNESSFFNLVTHYDMLNRINPERYNQRTIEEEAHALFF